MDRTRQVVVCVSVVLMIGTMVWFKDSWMYAIKHWRVTAFVVVLLGLHIYRRWHHDRRQLNDTKIEVLCLLDEAQCPLNDVQLLRLIKEEDFVARLPRALEQLIQSGQVQVHRDHNDCVRYGFSFSQQ